jgi:TolB-like protein
VLRVGQIFAWFIPLLLAAITLREAHGQNANTLALLPFENVSGNINGVRLIMPLIERMVREKGYQLVTPEKIEPFLARNRIRNTGMLGLSHLKALRQEFGVDLVMLGSVDLFYDSQENPQWGLSSRIVSAKEGAILWAESSGRTGGDYTKLLGLGTITSAAKLAQEVVRILFENLPPAGTSFPSPPGQGRPAFRFFGRKTGYRSQMLDSPSRWRVAVLPFENASERGGAGRILTDILTTALFRHGRFEVADPGEVNDALLKLGIVAYGGIDYQGLSELRKQTGVDAVFLGTLYGYNEGLKREAFTSPEVSLDLRMIHVETGKTLWFADGSRSGDDYRIALDFGVIRPMITLVMKVLGEMLETL